VIVDADMDISDLFAIAVLLRDPALDIRAIAIDGTGLVRCAGGRRVTRYLLEQLGRDDVPFACGRETPGPNGRSFPDEWRAQADAAYGLDVDPVPTSGVPENATDLIARAIAGSPAPPTIVALGPWTNLADAFAADESLVARVARIHAMAGAIDAPGNVLVDGLAEGDRLEWNVAADADAFAAVMALDVPVDLVPLDATDDVPVPPDLLERLEEDNGAAGANLAYELLVLFPERLSLPGGQLWDELAALAVSDDTLVTWEEAAVRVTEAGRIDRDAGGRPIRYAAAAHREAVEAALLAGLRRGGPRADPFAFLGEITVTWDGVSCAMHGSTPTEAGTYRAHLVNETSAPAVLTIVRVQSPHAWEELTALLAEYDFEHGGEPPDWIVPISSLEAGAGARGTGQAHLEPGQTGALCLAGEWPEISFVSAAPFEVGG
jgi:inosine-uridine nucleoside N-ribohydrolase